MRGWGCKTVIIYEMQEKLKMNRMNIFIICLIFLFLMPSLVEAKTADEWYNEGNDLGQSGKYEEAIKAFDEALKINPQFVDAWNNKGFALADLGRYEEAIIAYDEALKINPQDADVWFNKGVALKNLGRIDEANKAFDEALKLKKAPGFEIIFAIAGLVMIAHLLRRKE